MYNQIELLEGEYNKKINCYIIEISVIQPYNICPVGNVVDVLSARGSVPGPLFCKADGWPCFRLELSKVSVFGL